jgi:hypothetical protein
MFGAREEDRPGDRCAGGSGGFQSPISDAGPENAVRIPYPFVFRCARGRFERNGKPNRRASHDLGQATAHLALQTRSMGIAVHPIAGFSVERVWEVFGVPEGTDPIAAIEIGYPCRIEKLDETFREKEGAPRERKPQEDSVSDSAWGLPATWSCTRAFRGSVVLGGRCPVDRGSNLGGSCIERDLLSRRSQVWTGHAASPNSPAPGCTGRPPAWAAGDRCARAPPAEPVHCRRPVTKSLNGPGHREENRPGDRVGGGI